MASGLAGRSRRHIFRLKAEATGSAIDYGIRYPRPMLGLRWPFVRDSLYVIDMLKAGDDAPDFELRSHRGGTVKLSDYRGRQHVVLAFHPLAFTPVCANQMTGYESDLAAFERAGAAVLGISVDAQPAKAAWAKTLGPISYDLLSDFHPHGHVAQQYGVYRANDGISERAIFVVDKSGKVAWSKVYPIPELPKNREVLEALQGLA